MVKCTMCIYISFDRDLSIVGGNSKPTSLDMNFDEQAEQWVVFWGKEIEGKIASLQLVVGKDVADKEDIVNIAQSVE
jgi:hypothetical protein